MALGAFAVLTILLIVAAIPLSIIIFSRNYWTKKQSVGDGGGGLGALEGKSNIYMVSGCICDNFHLMYVGRLTRRKQAMVRCAPKQIGLICICSLETVRKF